MWGMLKNITKPVRNFGFSVGKFSADFTMGFVEEFVQMNVSLAIPRGGASGIGVSMAKTTTAAIVSQALVKTIAGATPNLLI